MDMPHTAHHIFDRVPPRAFVCAVLALAAASPAASGEAAVDPGA